MAKLQSTTWTKDASGVLTREHRLQVPLVHGDASDKRTITVYAREVAMAGATDREALVYLQGGPGFEAPYPYVDGGLGWLAEPLKHYRLILLDQRGTGNSTAVGRPWADTQTMVEYLTHLRSDSIVEDAEALRQALGIERWSLIGQSFGGFCVTRYVSAHSESLHHVYLTGGLPAVGHSLDEVYTATYAAMREKSEQFYARFPGDRERMFNLLEMADAGKLHTVHGDVIGVTRLRSLGMLLGASGGADVLHNLLSQEPGSWRQRWDIGEQLAFSARNPLYAFIHESCWADGQVTNWAAARTLPEDFKSDPTLLTGEHVSPKFFEEDSLLRDWADVAQALAEYPWPQLYSPQAMRASQVKGAAAVYFRDAYVPVQFSLETAALVPGLQTWVTSEYEHNGVRASGGAVFARLHELATGKVLR